MPIPDHIQVAYSTDDDVRKAYARQAAHDWHEFVAFRGRELSPGGQLVVTTMGLDEDGQLGFGPLVDAMMTTLTALVGTEVLTAEEHGRMSLPIVGRSAKDFESPFAPSGTFEKLNITHMELFDAEDRFWKQYRSDRNADTFGARWAAFLEAALFPTLALALDENRAQPEQAFFDALGSGIAQRLAAAPVEMRIPLAQLVIEKQSSTR
jgi:hypothetical protein